MGEILNFSECIQQSRWFVGQIADKQPDWLAEALANSLSQEDPRYFLSSLLSGCFGKDSYTAEAQGDGETGESEQDYSYLLTDGLWSQSFVESLLSEAMSDSDSSEEAESWIPRQTDATKYPPEEKIKTLTEEQQDKYKASVDKIPRVYRDSTQFVKQMEALVESLPDDECQNKAPYEVTYGFGKVEDLSKPHPGKCGRASSACGKYQFMKATAKDLNMKTLLPKEQDLACIKLFARRGLLDKILAGDPSWINERQAGLEWASFPDSPYKQPHRTYKELSAFYLRRIKEYENGTAKTPTALAKYVPATVAAAMDTVARAEGTFQYSIV